MRSFGPWLGLAGLLLSACGIAREDFVLAYKDRYCELVLQCSDPAELTFDGVLTKDDCIERSGYEITSWGLGCRYRSIDAEQCLADLDAAVCPAAVGELPERPLSCEGVYVDCGAVDAETIDSDTPAESPVDTDTSAP